MENTITNTNTTTININFNYLKSVLNYSYEDNYQKVGDEEINETLCLVYNIIGDSMLENNLFNHDHVFKLKRENDKLKVINTFSKDIFSFIQSLSDIMQFLDVDKSFTVSEYLSLRNDLLDVYFFNSNDELELQ